MKATIRLKRWASLALVLFTSVACWAQKPELVVQTGHSSIVYFAGHSAAQQNRFYLIPHDLGYDGPRTRLNESGLQGILAHSISDIELDQAFEKIDAGQILCQGSGSVGAEWASKPLVIAVLGTPSVP